MTAYSTQKIEINMTPVGERGVIDFFIIEILADNKRLTQYTSTGHPLMDVYNLETLFARMESIVSKLKTTKG